MFPLQDSPSLSFIHSTMCHSFYLPTARRVQTLARAFHWQNLKATVLYQSYNTNRYIVLSSDVHDNEKKTEQYIVASQFNHPLALKFLMTSAVVSTLERREGLNILSIFAVLN